MNWFALSLAAACTQAVQFAVVKGRARAIPPLVIVTWTQAIACSGWIAYLVVSAHPFAAPRRAWPAIMGSSVLVTGMSALLARASARGDISPTLTREGGSAGAMSGSLQTNNRRV